MAKLTRYLEKHLLFPIQINSSIHPDLGLVVVIPCYNETQILNTLESIWNCQRPHCAVEVIVVINSSEADLEEVVLCNQVAFWSALNWANTKSDNRLKFHILNFQAVASTIAGVGTARKIGMDEATWRFEQSENPKGIILSLDADCTVEENYLIETLQHFERNPQSQAASIHFEHELEGDEFPKIYTGIAKYELYLRYYIEGLRYADYPFAWHTVGSCMAVRSNAYQVHGGMNKREAGEDFYFLHKFMSTPYFTQITDTTVYPSPRVSDRVPFGTGRAMGLWMKKRGNDFGCYHPDCFDDLKKTISLFPGCYHEAGLNGYNKLMTSLPYSAIAFFSENGFLDKWKEMKANSASQETFNKRLFQWFNGLKVLQYIHHCRDHFYGEMPVEEAVTKLLERISGKRLPYLETKELLLEMRERERKVTTPKAKVILAAGT